jgi:hypothetical protein
VPPRNRAHAARDHALIKARHMPAGANEACRSCRSVGERSSFRSFNPLAGPFENANSPNTRWVEHRRDRPVGHARALAGSRGDRSRLGADHAPEGRISPEGVHCASSYSCTFPIFVHIPRAICPADGQGASSLRGTPVYANNPVSEEMRTHAEPTAPRPLSYARGSSDLAAK